ncbi:hypothetical protein MTX11_06925 [Acinetobacter lwoffii]|uniref:hypothetical protein n=1 Tax=Acinetobacter lwoffii TaxID=28090 RepID=UPI001FB3CC45|nr:hypothetical protein [Acinetobacter lwoffii]MCJ0927738.1 hypothetical protein [Acinetobacter lwoffii]
MPLLVKAIYNQQLQTNLIVPFESSVVLFVGFISIFFCAILSKTISNNYSSKMGYLVEDINFKKEYVLILLLLGGFFRLLHLKFNAGLEDGGGFGGFGVFKFVLLFALALAFKVYADTKDKKYVFYIVLALIIASGLAIVGNTKKDILDFILLSLLCIVFFKIKIGIKTIFSGLTFSLLVILFISPAIHLTRFEFRDLSFSERVEAVYRVIEENNFNYKALALAEGAFMQGFQFSYAEGGSYIYPESANLDRFFLILPIDQIVRSETTSMGVNPFLIEIGEAILPSFLISKTAYTGPDLIAWQYGIRDKNSIARPVIGFIGSSYASNGILAVIFYPIIFLFPFLLIMDYVFGKMDNRLWGVFGFIVTVSFVEKEIDQILPFIFRNLPIILIFTYFLLVLQSKKIKGFKRV